MLTFSIIRGFHICGDIMAQHLLRNNFTSVSDKGLAVVDYCLVPEVSLYVLRCSFQVNNVSELITKVWPILHFITSQQGA